MTENNNQINGKKMQSSGHKKTFEETGEIDKKLNELLEKLNAFVPHTYIKDIKKK